MAEDKERMPGRDSSSAGREPNYDPDLVHIHHAPGSKTPGWSVIYPAGVNPEFDGVEYDDDTIPKEPS